MDISNHRLIEDVLDGTALSFDACDDVSVGIGYNMKLTGSKKLGGDVMSIAQAGLLRSQGFEESSGFLLAHAPLEVHVPLRILEIDADFSFPLRREKVFVFFRRIYRPNQLRIVAHGVEQRMNVDPMAVRVFESIVVSACLRGNKPLSEAGLLHQLYLESGGGENVYRKPTSLRFRYGTLQNPLARPTVKGRFDGGVLFLEGVNQGNDLLVVQRAIKNDFAFDSGGLF